jgi:hypothetical protein
MQIPRMGSFRRLHRHSVLMVRVNLNPTFLIQLQGMTTSN